MYLPSSDTVRCTGSIGSLDNAALMPITRLKYTFIMIIVDVSVSCYYIMLCCSGFRPRILLTFGGLWLWNDCIIVSG